MESKIDQGTKQKIHEISGGVVTNKERAIKELLDLVLEIHPQVHRNLKL